MSRFAGRVDWWLVGALLLGLGLRLWGIDFGLPYTTAPDEPTHLSIALRIFRTGDLHPHWLNYPSLMFYLNALAYVPYYVIGQALGLLSSPADIPFPEIITTGVGRSSMPSQFLLGRGLTALFGTGSILLVYCIGRELHPSRLVAVAAALLLAVSPASVYNSHLIRPDTFAVFFALVSVFGALRILRDPSLANYLLAGAGAGLAVSSKYNMPLIVLPLIVAHFARWGVAGLRRREVYFGLAASVLAFFLTTPFALLDVQTFLRDMGYEVTAQAAGHAGTEGNTIPWYLEFVWLSEGITVVAAVVQAARLFWARSRPGLVLVAFPIVYLLFISQFIVRNDRTILPVFPFLHLLAAWLVADLYASLVPMLSRSRLVAAAALAALVALLVAQPLNGSIISDSRLGVVDSRDTTRGWIEENLAAGSRVAVEPYGPYIDPRRFMVQGGGMAEHAPEWYLDNGFEYLVLSYGTYGRFFEEPERYPDFVKRYNALSDRYREIKRFDDNGFEIRVYATDVTGLPPHRVGAQWGVYTSWLELVGYDWHPPSLTLHWRPLDPRAKSLKPTATLLDEADRVIAQFSGAPLSAGASSEGTPQEIVRMLLAVAVPADQTPGLYRVQITVDAEDLGRIPVLSFDRKPVSDKLFIGPVKFPPPQPLSAEWEAAKVIDARFGGISLAKYRLSSSAPQPGETLRLALYWKSAETVQKDYTVFVHLVDPDGNLRAQKDAMPCAGKYPTSVWSPGEIVPDEYELSLPHDLTRGNYTVRLGMYEYPSLQRLSVTGADGKLLGDHLVLPEPIRVGR